MAGTGRTTCTVRGRWGTANGLPDTRSFAIRPEHGGWLNGAWYAATEVVIVPAADGSWSADLLPSSVMGEYTVERRGQRFKMVVPERAGVEFQAIAEPIG